MKFLRTLTVTFLSVSQFLFLILFIFSIQLNVAQARQTCSLLFTSVSEHELALKSEASFATAKIIENISRPDGLPGAVVAARTRESPNYYYHWIRDAGLVIEAVLGRYQSVGPSAERGEIRFRVLEYLGFSKKIQSVETLTGLGEPKVNVDGTAFDDPWGRPQNDSPALRAVSLITLAKQYGQLGKVRLEEMGLGLRTDDPSSVLRKDLDYVVRTWRDPSYDLWEEVMGHHFYTRMVQRRALLDGADWAMSLGDSKLASIYRLEAEQIERTLDQFWNSDLGYIQATLPLTKGELPVGLTGKDSGMDIAVILGLMHGGRGDGFMPFSSPKVLATLEKIEAKFKALYAINRDVSIPGTAIGRYPEDMFNGADRAGGNPWVLATLAMGEAYYRIAAELRAQSSSVEGAQSSSQESVSSQSLAHTRQQDHVSAQVQAMIAKGDSFLGRVRYHRHRDGSLNEQFNRETGYMHSVEDLTWSYAAMVTALSAREAAVRQP